ncbi:hypothetical protein DEW08_00120 [Azospirillum thermophilum]|uniref:Uncharacterized protein n=1 Tax=Azospirillum thermophilum TaxID=2202148 RepID=A0A2S2CMQ0_9PROT|nr:hypothetical protein DEW08_00120 [Azospirillum thermophilum]
MRTVLRPVVTVLALLYFLVDALVYWVIRPFAAWIGRRRVFALFAAWVSGLGPYPTLALFLVPLIVLEPAKPVGAWLVGTGRPVEGALVIAVAELLKVTLVERLFRLGRDKLMTIPAFAWVHVRLVAWLGWLKGLPPWLAVVAAARRVKQAARTLALVVRQWVT